MLKDMMKTAGTLFLVVFLVTLILIFGNYFTKDRIAMRRETEEIAVKQQVLPEAAQFEDVLFEELATGEKLAVGYDADNQVIGYCVTTVSKGYGGEMTVMTGVHPDATISQVRILEHEETASVGSKAATNPELLLDFYADRKAPFTVTKSATKDLGSVTAISGATITSRAVNQAVNRAAELAEHYLASVTEEGTEND